MVTITAKIESPNRGSTSATSSTARHPFDSTLAIPSLQPSSTQPSSAFDVEAILDSIQTLQTKPSISGKSITVENGAVQSNFDPIEFLNHHFQTEASLLSTLRPLRSSLRQRIATLDTAISSAIQKQTDVADQNLSDLARAKAAVLQLQQRVAHVRSRASQSEHAVQEITEEMKRLDTAKRNLSKTITALKRLHMLVHAVAELDSIVVKKPFPDYATAAQLVEATWSLLAHFDAYTHYDKVRVLKDVIEKRREDLFRGIVFGFRVVGFNYQTALAKETSERRAVEGWKGSESGAPVQVTRHDHDMHAPSLPFSPQPMPTQTLIHACRVVNALGSKHKKEFLTLFCVDHLESYDQIFHPKNNISSPSSAVSMPNSSSSAATTDKPTFKKKVSVDPSIPVDIKDGATLTTPNSASLDQVERRFDWYRRMLRELESKFPSVFPSIWNIHYQMTFTFLTKTQDHYLLLFASKDGPDKILRDRDCENVSILLKALQKTVLFEKEMTAWLQRDYHTNFRESTSLATSSSTAKKPIHKLNEQGEDEVTEKSEKVEHKEKKKEDPAKVSKDMSESDETEPVAPLIGIASRLFERNLQPYVSLEEKTMEDLLTQSTSDSTVDTRGERPVFTSSTDLFVYIKNSITRCTALTKGKTFYSLYVVYKETLKKYSQVLSGKLPATLALQGDEKIVCDVIDTCEYCAETVEALQDLITDKIDKEFKEKVDMNGEQEAFHDVTAKAIRLLVSGLLQRTETPFKEMSLMNWATLNAVGEESKYVHSIHDAIQPFVVTVGGLLPTSYFKSFCDKFAASFTTAYYNAILRLKRISESGTQQLLLDVYNLKTLVLKLPTNEMSKKVVSKTSPPPVSSVATSTASAAYTKMVTSQFQRIEILLKLVGTPAETLIEVFKVQWVGGTASDLQSVMGLKGMKRNEQVSMLEKFGVDPSTVMKGPVLTGVTSAVTENIQQVLHDRSSDVAAKMNSEMKEMRQKVDEFRKAFR